MGSVRDRIEREQRQRQEPPAPAMRRGSPQTVAAVTASTRERASAAEHQAAGDEILPKLGPRAGGMTANQSNNGSVRGRLEQARAAEEAKKEIPTRTALAEFYLAEHYRQEAEQKERELEAQRLQNERIAKEKAIEASNARALVVGLCFDQFAATPAERKRILALPGAQDASPETLVSQLLEVRELHAFAENCNDAEAEARRKK